jgi:hypothetical protein
VLVSYLAEIQFRKWGLFQSGCAMALLRFRLLEGEKEVYGFFNLGRGAKPKAGRRSRFFEAWTMANGGAPRKRQTMTARVFRGKVFRVAIADVDRNCDGKPHHPSAIYSTVKRILEKEAG